MKVFRGYVAGYFFSTTSAAEMQAWIDKRRGDCKGHKIRIDEGKRYGDTDVYGAHNRFREAIL